jgi:hypothetical protein
LKEMYRATLLDVYILLKIVWARQLLHKMRPLLD